MLLSNPFQEVRRRAVAAAGGGGAAASSAERGQRWGRGGSAMLSMQLLPIIVRLYRRPAVQATAIGCRPRGGR